MAITQVDRHGQGLDALHALAVIVNPGQHITLILDIEDLDFVALRFRDARGLVLAVSRVLEKVTVKHQGVVSVRYPLTPRAGEMGRIEVSIEVSEDSYDFPQELSKALKALFSATKLQWHFHLGDHGSTQLTV